MSMNSTDTLTPNESAGEIANLGVSEDAQQSGGRSLTQLAIRRLRRDYLTLFAMSIILVFAILAISAPLIDNLRDVSYRETNPPNKYQPIGTEGHILGTDNLGRDHLSRLFHGGQVSLGIGFAAALLSIAIGLTFGLLTGYYAGGPLSIIDDFMMWFITTLNSIPQLFLLIIIASVLSPSVTSLILILALLGWTGTMRLIRGETLSQRNREYVVAARSIGAGAPRIMFRHIMPNVFGILIVTLAINIGNLILVEAALSFLSLGIQEPTPSWGNMLVKAQAFFRESPMLAVVPGVLISTTVLCCYIIGDGLRDAFDPQLSKD